MATILLADDDLTIRRTFRTLFESEGFTVRLARNGQEAVALQAQAPADIVVLDVMMPVMGGIQACAELRRRDPLVPILYLTAMPSDATQVRALGAGADDYIDKSVNSDVLMAKLRAALRRVEAQRQAADSPQELILGQVRVDLTHLCVTDSRGKVTELTRTEALVLAALAAHRGEYVSTDALFSAVRGEGFVGNPGVIRNHVAHLRRKLGPAGDLIVNNINAGYELLR